MSRVRVVRTERFDHDALSAVAFHDDSAIGLGLVDALEVVVEGLADFPDSGSPRWAIETGIEDLRSVRAPGYPWRIFYLRLPDHMLLIRLLQ